MSDLVVGYLPYAGRRPGAGVRVRADGSVELSEDGAPWRPVARLTGEELAGLERATREAGIPELPPELPAPDTLDGGSDCEWWTDLGGRPVHSVVHGWSDLNPAARPSRELVMELYRLVAAAQARGGS